MELLVAVQMKRARLLERLGRQKAFQYLWRRATPDDAARVAALKLAGVGVFTVTTLAVGTAGVAHLAATLNTVQRAETGTALTKKETPDA